MAPRHMRAANALSVLRAIRSAGSTSRAEVTEQTGLSAPAVTTLVRELIARNLVVEMGTRPSGTRGGKPATSIGLNPKGCYFLSVMIGIRAVWGAVVDLSGEVRAQLSQRTQKAPEALLAQLASIRNELIDSSGLSTERFGGAGVGIPGWVDETGTLVECPLAAQWEQVISRPRLEATFGRPVFVENDAGLKLLGASWNGAAAGCENVFFFDGIQNLGTAALLDGKLLRGQRGRAAQLAHLEVPGNRRQCPCGRVGCLNTLVSTHGIMKSAHQRLAQMRTVPPAWRDFAWQPDVGIAPLRRAWQAHDPLARELVDETVEWFGWAAKVARACFDPELILVCSDLCELEGVQLQERLQNAVSGSNADRFGSAPRVQILPMRHGSSQAAVAMLGGAELAARETVFSLQP